MITPFALGYAPTNPDEYHNEVFARIRSGKYKVSREATRARLAQVLPVVNLSQMHKETGVSLKFLYDLNAGADKGHVTVKPHALVDTWLDKYEDSLKRDMPAILARRAKFKEYNERRKLRQTDPASAPARTVLTAAGLQRAVKALNLAFDLGKSNLMDDLPSTELAKLARSLANTVRSRQAATTEVNQPQE